MKFRKAAERARSPIALVFAMISILLIAISGGGCEAIVPDTIPGFTCTGSDLSGCPAGEYCDGVGCAKCALTDVCDGFDNDCNGKVDDGPLCDHDQDTWTTCGHTNPTTGEVFNYTNTADVDCNDNDPNVHPGAKEVCNGIDDDCDGVIDNADQVCPSGQVCAPATKQCLTECTTANCTGANHQCDPKTQVCVDTTAPKTALGGACASDETCATGLFCAFSTILGGLEGDSVCSKPCCNSGTCDSGFVCAATGTGGRYCLAANKIGRSAPGTDAAGASCGDGTTCRSGLCTGGKCIDSCCTDVDCGNGTACIEQTVGAHSVFACGSPGSGNEGGGSVCDGEDSKCRNDFCVNIGDPRGNCIAPCCTSANSACGTAEGVALSCTSFGLQGSSDVFEGCAGGTGTGNAAFGAPCTTATDCTSGNCNTSATPSTCTDSCCTDADCPSGSSTVCRPDANGALRCVAGP